MDQRRKLGATGEALAVRYLTEDGLTILARNWRCPSGELDIVAQESAPDYANEGHIVPWLVLVEVRTRRGTQFGTALQSITPRKQAKLRQVAEEYVRAHEWSGPWRIDVVGIQMNSAGRLEAIDHIRHAVTG
ncbi:YraN family protein [Chloroflexi bacterium TSY]|nr:YraN family protein [Chloroflexi bacterium TSY]